MSKENKKSASEELLSNTARSLESSEKLQPAGKKAVEATIRGEKKEIWKVFNLRLNQEDTEALYQIEDHLRNQNLRNFANADCFRLALRTIAKNPRLLEGIENLLSE